MTTDNMELSGSTKYGIVKVEFWAKGNFAVKNNKEICKLRDKLQCLILMGADYSEICKVSQELDELIIKYYALA